MNLFKNTLLGGFKLLTSCALVQEACLQSTVVQQLLSLEQFLLGSYNEQIKLLNAIFAISLCLCTSSCNSEQFYSGKVKTMLRIVSKYSPQELILKWSVSIWLH